MKRSTGRALQKIRIAVQLLVLLIFVYFLVRAASPFVLDFTGLAAFFYLDPLVAATYLLATHQVLPVLLWSLLPLMLTLLLGRFFCGWICPFGALQQFFTWLARNRRKKVEKKAFSERQLRSKYVILLLILAFSLLGLQLMGWLDPFSLLTRAGTVSVLPGMNNLLQHSLQIGAQDKGLVSKALHPVYRFVRRNVLAIDQPMFEQTVFIGLVFFTILALNFYRRRFFCNVLCPLGALYAWLARFSPLSFKLNDKCTSCGLCDRNCTYYEGPFKRYLKTECLLCLNCTADCPSDALDLVWKKPVSRENRPGVDLGRRVVAASLVSGLFLGNLPKVSGINKPRTRGFIRPPGAIREKEFLAQCLRCSACMQVCPTKALQPAFMQAGLEGIWTPLLIPTIGYCEYDCNRCTQVCPTLAIRRLNLEEKQAFKIGTAVIDRDRCFTYADGYDCAVCEEHCPVPDKAIRFRDVEVYDYRGDLVTVKQIYVVPELCIGCGICENVCPRTDFPAIVVCAEEEERTFLF